MPGSTFRDAAWRVRRKLGEEVTAHESDASLLQRFLNVRDEDAFAEIVWRHGPMVRGVGRRFLDDESLAEDVFQAAFLLLARKARQLPRGSSIGGWLHGVAVKLSLAARRSAFPPRRESHFDRGKAMATPLQESISREELQLVDEELARLDDNQRTVLVLCVFEGLTHDEAAIRLGRPVGTVKSWLSRGREILARRLERRGVVATVALAAMVVGNSAPAELLETTVRAARAVAAGEEVASAGLSSGALKLVRETLRGTFMTKLKLSAALVAAVGSVGYGASTLVADAPKPSVTPQAEVSKPETAKLELPKAIDIPADSPETRADRAELVKGNTEFAFDLYKKLAESLEIKGKNLFISPYSISTALAMTSAGANGKTLSEMERVLHFTLPQEKLHRANAGLYGLFQAEKSDRGYELSTANSLWGQKNEPWKREFLQTVHGNYGSGFQECDFRDDKNREVTRKSINDWVENRTKEKIKELLQKEDITGGTLLVLVNAIYFKGEWQKAFDPKMTAPRTFYGDDKKEIKIPTMSGTGEYGYKETNDVKCLELPYKGEELSMILLMSEKNSLAKLEQDLSPKFLDDVSNNLKVQKVSVHLPKFTTKSRTYLSGILEEELGMKEVFGNGDFTRMTGKSVSLSQVIHQSFVDVNEEGTEAAAATAVTTRAGRVTANQIEFHADRPFLYFIRHKPTGAILFMGRFCDPSEMAAK